MPTKFKKEILINLPKYIRLGPNGCAMRLIDPEYDDEAFAEYWRDAGLWGVDIRIDIEINKIFSIHKDIDWLNDIELYPMKNGK